MADFATGATLELEVSRSSLSQARDTIESELGDLEVGVDAVVSGNGGGMQPRDPSSGRFMSIEGVEQRVVNTNDTLDGLIQIETERWELDKVRNNHLEQLAEGGGVGGGGGGGAGLLGGARAAVGGSGLAAALGGGGLLAGIFGANEAIGDTSSTDLVARSLVQGGGPTGFISELSTRLGSSLVEGAASNFEWPEIPEPPWVENISIGDEQRARGVENRMRENQRSRQSGIEDVEFSREQRARGNENRQREEQASRTPSRRINVDNSIDVRVEQGQSFEQIADEAVDRVEREAIEPLRAQIRRGLGGDV